MKKFKFVHDEIHGNLFPRVETILELREDLKMHHLFMFLREHKMKEGQSSLDIFGVYIEDGEEWKKLSMDYNQGVKGEPIHTEKLTYYQMLKNPSEHEPLGNKWVGCGGVNENTKNFYLDHFSKNYHRNTQDKADCKVIIVRGSFGNVADRDARAIVESDIVEKYNFSEGDTV
jgi:hypothetical protein